jgi:hypothetical protein
MTGKDSANDGRKRPDHQPDHQAVPAECRAPRADRPATGRDQKDRT